MKEKIGALCDTYFNPRHILERTWWEGGCNPHVISPLFKIELLDEY